MKVSYDINLSCEVYGHAEVRARDSPYELGGTLELSSFLEVKHVVDYIKYEIKCYHADADVQKLNIDVYYKNKLLDKEDNNVRRVIDQIDSYPTS